MNSDPELYASILRHAGIALNHTVLNLDSAARSVYHATKLDQRPVPYALDHAPIVHGDGRIDQVAAQHPQPRQSAILVRAGEPAVADHVSSKDRHKFADFVHLPSSTIRHSIDARTRPLHFERRKSRRRLSTPIPLADGGFESERRHFRKVSKWHRYR